jgi:hypothetical protein
VFDHPVGRGGFIFKFKLFTSDKYLTPIMTDANPQYPLSSFTQLESCCEIHSEGDTAPRLYVSPFTTSFITAHSRVDKLACFADEDDCADAVSVKFTTTRLASGEALSPPVLTGSLTVDAVPGCGAALLLPPPPQEINAKSNIAANTTNNFLIALSPPRKIINNWINQHY